MTVDGPAPRPPLAPRPSTSAWAASCPQARRHGRRPIPRDPAFEDRGQDLDVHPGQRRHEHVPLGGVDQPFDRFERPNHGDPFVTPVSPLVTLRFRTDVPLGVVVNGSRTSSSADGLTTWGPAMSATSSSAPRPTIGPGRPPSARRPSACGTRPGRPLGSTWTLPSTPSRRSRRGRGRPPRADATDGGVGGRRRHGGPRRRLDPGRRGALEVRYLVTHELAHQWFYGLVGNDQAREPFADEAITDMVARYLTGTRRGSRCTRDPRPDHLRVLGPLLLRAHLHPGRQPPRRCPPEDGHRRVLRGPPPLPRGASLELVHTRTLLDALDAATRWIARDGEPGSRPCTEDTRAVARCPTLTPRHTGRRAGLRRDLRAVRGGHLDLLRARAARRRRDGRPDRADVARTPWLVVEVDGVVRAYAYATRHRERPAYDWTVETAVYVDREFARQGLGRIAMRAVLAILRLQGAHLVVAGITLPNEGSVELHLPGLRADRGVRGDRLEVRRLARGGLVRARAGTATDEPAPLVPLPQSRGRPPSRPRSPATGARQAPHPWPVATDRRPSRPRPGRSGERRCCSWIRLLNDDPRPDPTCKRGDVDAAAPSRTATATRPETTRARPPWPGRRSGPRHARRDGTARGVLMRPHHSSNAGGVQGTSPASSRSGPSPTTRSRAGRIRPAGRSHHPPVPSQRVEEQLGPHGAVVGPKPRRRGVEESRQVEREVDRQPGAGDGGPRLVERSADKTRRHGGEHRATPWVRGDQRAVRVQGRHRGSQVSGIAVGPPSSSTMTRGRPGSRPSGAVGAELARGWGGRRASGDEEACGQRRSP